MLKVILNYSNPSIEFICALKLLSHIEQNGCEVEVYCDVGWLARDYNFKPLNEVRIGPFDQVLTFNVSNNNRLFFLLIGKSNLRLGRRNLPIRLLIYLKKCLKNLGSILFGYSRLDLRIPTNEVYNIEKQIYAKLRILFSGDIYISDINRDWRNENLDVFAESDSLTVLSSIVCPNVFRNKFSESARSAKRIKYLGFPYHKVDFLGLKMVKTNFVEEVLLCLSLLRANRGKHISY